MFQHQTNFVPHAANCQSSTLNLKDSEIRLPTMAQKSQISNDDSQSVSTDKALVAMKQSPVSPTRRKYFCEYCSKAFTRNGHLTMHRRTHTGERPFVCQYCNRAFTQSSALYRHHKTCANSPHRGNNDVQPKTDPMLDGASAISTQRTSAFPVSRDTVSTADDWDRKDESSDEDDDIMFVCCDSTFNSPADYDQHMETHHSKSSTDSLPRFSKPGGGEKTPSLAPVQLSSSSYRHDATSCNNTGLDLSNTVVSDLGQRTNACEPNTRVIDNESGIVYLFNNNTTQDIVTINLSEHSVNHSERGSGKFPSNMSIMDESANPEMMQITPKLTSSSNDSVNDDDDVDAVIVDDDDDDVCIETVSMTTQQNTEKLTVHDEIFITENSASGRRQINQPVALKKQKETYLRFSESFLDVACQSSSYDSEQHQKSLSGSSYVRNLPNSLSFVRSAPENANKKADDANNPEKSVKTNKGNTKIEKTVSGNKRIKTSRLQSCPFCSRQFIRSSHLTQHLRTHTRERPFRCEYCGNAFTQSSALNRHLKTCNIAQSVNSSVAGNTTSSHQSSASSRNINAGNDVYIPYTGDVFQQSTLLDSRLKAHKDPSNSKADMRNPASKCNSMSLRDDNDSADNIRTAISRMSILKNKSCAAKMARRLIEDQTTQPKKKFLLQKPFKSERMLRCDICCVEFLSRQHFTTHMRKHLRANPGLARSVPSLSRSSPTSSFTWPFYMKSKHSLRNKFYNALKYKRNFEKQKSSPLATNSQFGHASSRTKTNSFVEKIVKKFKPLSRRSKPEDSRTSNQLHHSNMSPMRNASSENKKIVTHQSFEKSIQNSVATDTNRNPQNSLYFSGPAHEINPHRTNRISTKLYSCNICAKSFYSDLLLRIHRATHSLGTKKRNFLLQSTSVMVQNKAEKTYPCVYCHKRFLRHSHVETHIRTHTGEKPFKCENCGRAFSQSSARNRHRNKTCFVARRQVRNSILLSPPSSDYPDLTASIWNIPQTQDEDTSSVLFTCCDQSFHSSIDLNTHLLNHKSSRRPLLEETGCNSGELGPQCEAELESNKKNDDNDRETANYISQSPIKCEESADNDFNVNKYKHSPVDSHAGDSILETGKSQKFPFESDARELVSKSKEVLNSTVKNEFDVLGSKIFDNALQVVHDNLQMPSDVHVEQSASNQTKAVPLSEQNPGSLESVSSQNCQDPSDLCPSPPDIPQPNVSLSLGSEFVDIMDTDLPSISNPIPCNQEEDSSAQQKDIFLEYSPETPPFVGECLTQSLGVDDVMENDENAKTCKPLSGGASEPTPDFDGPDKKYSCDYCNKTFSRLDHLDEHIGIHTSERFFCPSCSAAFTHTSALGKHLKICPRAADHVKKESASKNPFDTPNTIGASQVMTNTNNTDESINGYKLSTVGCLEATTNDRDSASQEATANTNNKNNVNTNNNLHESFENWTLTSFSNDDDVKSENMGNFMSSEKKEETAENTNNSMFKNITRPNQLKPLIGSTLDICEKETSLETNSPASTRKLTCPHCDRHFASLGQLDGHILCHAVKKPYTCWFCKDTYVSSLDFEQHLKICGAPTTFPNLSSSPNASKEDANDDEESKFTDIVLFTPLTASGNLSDCEGVGEADLPCNKDQMKDTGVSQQPQQSKAEASIEGKKAEDVHEEKSQTVRKAFESTELISGQLQENCPRDSDLNPDNGSKYTPDFVLLEDSREKDDSSTVQNVTSDKSTSNQSDTNMNLKNTFTKEQIHVANKALQKDFNLESLSQPSLINSSEYNTNMEAEHLKTQSPSEGSNDSIVFLCCEQTFTEVQDYSQHLSKFHPTQERTDKLKDLDQQQMTPSEIQKDGSRTSEISRSVSKQSDAGNDQQRYVCSCCTRGFSRSSHLVQHMRTHTGERPFSCKYCMKAFTQSSAVNRHLKTCIKAKLFQNESVKIMSTNYDAVMHEFQQTLPERSGSISHSPVHTFDDMKHNISVESNPFQQPSHVTYEGIDNIPDNEISAGIKCEHCGLKWLRLDDFTQHCKTCPSTESTSYLGTAYHEEDSDSAEAVDNAESYNHKLPHAYHLEDVEIKKEVADVLYKCEVCHQLFLDESELIQHRESHSTSSDQQWWNVALDFSSRKDLKTTKEDEERSIFNCCGQMFFDSKSYKFHMEVRHSFKVENDYSEINGSDGGFQEMQNSAEKIDVKNEGIDLDKISRDNLANDSLLNSSLQGRQLLSMAKNRFDNVIEKKSSEASDLSLVNKSTALDAIQRFQVSESVKDISQSETSILLQRIANGNVHDRMSNLGDSIISKKTLGMNLSASAASERTLTNDMNMDWLQWKNYITGQFLSSGLSTAQMMPREKKYVCDYCDKRFTRSGHLVMHRRTHTGERPFRCRHCQKAFTQSSALNRHLKTCNLARLAIIGNAETRLTFPVSEDEIQLTCCGKNFYSAGAVNVHLVTHDIYKCHCCNVDFENFNLLLIHMKSRDPHEQLPVSNLRGQSTDDHCVFCPASFQSVIEQLLHVKTSHQVDVSEIVSSDNHITPDQVNFPRHSSKSTNLDVVNFSKDSDLLSSQKYTNPSLRSTSPQQKGSFSNQLSMGKMPRFKRLLSSTFRKPSKLNTFLKRQQNKSEINPASTLLKQRYSILFPEHKLTGSPKYTRYGSSLRNAFTHNTRQVFKQDVNSISKPDSFSEQFTTSSDEQVLTQTNEQQTIGVGGKRFPDQRQQTETVETLLDKKDMYKKNSKNASPKDVVENNSLVQKRKYLFDKLALNGRNVDYYSESEADNDLDHSSYQAESSMAINLEQEQGSRTQSGKCLKSDMLKYPSLKSRSSNSLPLKRSSLTRRLVSAGSEKNPRLTKAVPIPIKFNFKYGKSKRASGSTLSSKQSDFVCIVCQKYFTCSSHLRLHLRTHADVWPYVCTNCNHYFIQASALNRHHKNCPYRNQKSTSSNSQANRNSVLQNPGTSKLSTALLDKDKDTSAFDEGEISLAVSQDETDTVKKSKEVLSNEHDKLPSSFYRAVHHTDDSVNPSPKKGDNYLNTDNSTCSNDPSDRTGLSLPQSAHSKKDKSKPEIINEQLVISPSRQLTSGLADSTLVSFPGDRRDPISHTCKKCDATFLELTDLNQHKCSWSADRRAFFCEYCDKSFPRQSRLVTHRRTHTGERPYQCIHCQRSFTQSGALNRHKKICSFIPTHLKTTASVVGSTD